MNELTRQQLRDPHIVYNDVSMKTLGVYLSTWDGLSNCLQILFMGLHRTDFETAQMIFGPLATRDQLKIVEELIDGSSLPERRRARVKKFVSKIERLSFKRNKIIHAGWWDLRALSNKAPNEQARVWVGLSSERLTKAMTETTPQAQRDRASCVFSIGEIRAISEEQHALTARFRKLEFRYEMIKVKRRMSIM